jgi:membrane protein
MDKNVLIFNRGAVSKLLRRVPRNVVWHDCFGKAAELGFYFQLALFPLLIFLLSLTSFMRGAEDIVISWLGTLMPSDSTQRIEKWVHNILSTRSGGLLSFGLIFSLWSASQGVRALLVALNRAYEVEEGRPFWKSQLLALGITLALCLLVIGGVVFIAFGNPLLKTWGDLLGLEEDALPVWSVLHYSTGLAMLILGMACVYYFGPNVKQDLRQIAPGTLFAITAFIIVSYLFSLYLRYAPSYYAVYGSLGAVIILMLWLYLMAFIMYLGAEINAEVQKLAGKPVGQKQ